MVNFTPGQITTAQARALNDMQRRGVDFSKLNVAAPLNKTQSGGVINVSLDTSGFGSGGFDSYATDTTAGVDLTTDAVTDTGLTVTVPAGTYLIIWQVTAFAEVTAIATGEYAGIWASLYQYDTANPSGLPIARGVFATAAGVGYGIVGTGTSWYYTTVTESTEFKVRAQRLKYSGSWTEAQVFSSSGISFIEAFEIT
jgi:hypothetical protein